MTASNTAGRKFSALFESQREMRLHSVSVVLLLLLLNGGVSNIKQVPSPLLNLLSFSQAHIFPPPEIKTAVN